ncbi:aldehyde dehydrogenase family protein [Nocardia grenadensis]|uniref:aldehyde dehydrogenase family protein n=1 Tax=Nocardia grenadensis TaxID=931537 RepID=UPI0009FDF5FB|nr:aldehyde dehydrogenase family protein [Nocardia grenadensis]
MTVIGSTSPDSVVAENRRRALEIVGTIPYGLFIDGEFVVPQSPASIPVVDPASGSVIAEVAEARRADVDAAVSAAQRAFTGPWSTLRPSERAGLLWRLAEGISRMAEEFALMETLDNGKPLELARGDIAATVEVFRYYAGWADKIDGRSVTPATLQGWQGQTRRQPLGVVGQIIPWNFPLNMASWKLAPALATGNTVVLKPSELTPLTALMLGRLISDCGFPPGVVNIVPGFGNTAGAALAGHPDVAKVAFTGSVETGRAVAHMALGTLKRVSLELGGKSPTIVLPDADVEAAAAGVCRAIFTNQGEVCTAGSRAYIHEALYDRVLSEVSAIAHAMVIGNGLDPAVDLGPLVSAQQRDRVAAFVERARAGGATIDQVPVPEDVDGYYYPPTIVSNVQADAEIATSEVFGPVLVVHRYTDDDGIVALANDSEFGLAAGIWGRDLAAVLSIAERLQAGSVWVNGYHAVDPALPFGGWKSSGWGRELGPDALELYTETKSINIFVG